MHKFINIYAIFGVIYLLKLLNILINFFFYKVSVMEILETKAYTQRFLKVQEIAKYFKILISILGNKNFKIQNN